MYALQIPASRFLQRCFAAFETPSHVFFVTEYLKGGDLFFHLTRRVDATAVSSINAGFSEKEAKILLSEVVLGLVHMHKHNFIHCDIKVENIMLDARGHVKLIDFGLAAEISKPEEPVSPIGSLIYMAPELLTKGNTGERVLPTQVEKCLLFFFGIKINSPARHSYKKNVASLARI